MSEQGSVCKSVFKNGTISKEIYTAAWISFLNQIKGRRYVLAPKEERA